jgi:hypothetical protein
MVKKLDSRLVMLAGNGISRFVGRFWGVNFVIWHTDQKNIEPHFIPTREFHYRATIYTQCDATVT